MNYLQFSEFIKSCGVPRTEAEDGEIALTKADALKAVEILFDSELGILGGDVYELESDGYFRPTYDNWYCNKDDLPLSDFVRLSHEKATRYLQEYKEADGLNIRYVLVVDA